MKRNHKLKGMTLMEVVISIGVYAVIALLLTLIMSLVNQTMKATNQLNRRLSYEAKFADNLMINDGHEDFAGTPITVTFSNSNPNDAHPFSTNPQDGAGIEYQVNSNHLERLSGVVEDDANSSLIFNTGTHYRFMIFTKTIAPIAGQPDSFDIILNLSRDTAHQGEQIPIPISKVIIKGNAYKIGENSGTVYPEQTIVDTAKHSMAGLSDVEVYNDSTLEQKRNHGSEILTISVPTKQDNGNPIGDPQHPSSIEVLIFTNVVDNNGTQYFWYNKDNRDFVAQAYNNLDPNNVLDQPLLSTLDRNTFPSTSKLTLTYNTYDRNPNTNADTFFRSLTYTWNYDDHTVTCGTPRPL